MKRFATMLLALALTLSCGLAASAAAGDSGLSPQASYTISSTSAYAYTGDNSGEVDFEFTITATGDASKLGAATIVIHKPDLTTYTVTGTFNNGLLSSGNAHVGSYIYKGIKGHSYYADVTLTSTVGSRSDSRTITTNSATAK